jgi:hypothetical protein
MKRIVDPDESVSYALLCTVAEVEGCYFTDLPLLHETLDTDALDALFSLETDKSSQFAGTLMFEYSDSFISIWSDRSVTISIAS